MKRIALVSFLILGLGAVASAEQDGFLNRDQTSPAETYLGSDGAVVGDQPAESAWDTWVGDAPPSKAFEMPGIWPILQTAPELQTFVAGPTFRNQKSRIEIGAGLGYINSKWRFPFELSVEPTWRRNKNADPDNRTFSRVRTFALVDLWGRSSDWESTSFAATAFYDTQNRSFDTLEFGGSVTQVIGRRLAISGNLVWGGEWANGAKFNNAAVGSFGASYNLGAGARFGGFFEPHNNLYHDNDFGGFVAYQLLPFAELAVNAGKHEFVMVRLMMSYALERP